MPYRIKRGESVQRAFTRIIGEQIDLIVAALPDPAADSPANDIHKARKHCKKIRAVLRLYRPALGDNYSTANARFRDAAKLLSRARDAEAMLETLGTIRERCPEAPLEDALAAATMRLHTFRQSLLEQETDGAQITRFLETVRAGRLHVESIKLPDDGFGIIKGGLAKTYKRGRKAYRKAYASPSGESFHEWRKRVKYHLYHIRLLQNVWPEVLKARKHQLQKLSDLLGDDHDLVVLREFLCDKDETAAADACTAPLLDCIDQQQSTLRATAEKLGKKLYAGKTKHLAKRINTLWEAWKLRR